MGGDSKEFFKKEVEQVKTENDILLKKGGKGPVVGEVQTLLNKFGYDLAVDQDFGPKTEAAVKDFQSIYGLTVDGIVGPKTYAALKKEEPKPEPPPVVTGDRPVNPAYEESKKYIGKKETDPEFNKWVSSFWKLAGLPSYKTIVGTSFAWCALWIIVMNTEVGQNITGLNASAPSARKWGVAIDYKKDGLPRGAVVYLDHQGNCDWEGSHVTFVDGDCTPEDVKRAGASFPGLGGNQSNTVKRSNFPMAHICAVRWPKEVKKPGPVTKSVDCGGKAEGESTR